MHLGFGWKRLCLEEWYHSQVQRSYFWSEKRSFLPCLRMLFYREKGDEAYLAFSPITILVLVQFPT